EWTEKTPGQLFCVDSSRPILDLLLTECEWAGVQLRIKQDVSAVEKRDQGFTLTVNGKPIFAESLAVATGAYPSPPWVAALLVISWRSNLAIQFCPPVQVWCLLPCSLSCAILWPPLPV